MLEEIQKLPEDRRKVRLVMDVGLVAFGLSTLADGMLSQGGAVPVVFGATAALAGLASLRWLRAQPAAVPARG